MVGIKVSEVMENGYYTPQVADARSITIPNEFYQSKNDNFMAYFFANVNKNSNGGYWAYLRDVYLPDGLFKLCPYLFLNCPNLTNIYGDLSKVTVIFPQVFYGCKSLKEFPYMPNLNEIRANAFYGCTGLTELKFYKTPETGFVSTAFAGCTNITDIYVPWSEGEVANAPWGATNATIHYNTVYDSDGNPIT